MSRSRVLTCVCALLLGTLSVGEYLNSYTYFSNQGIYDPGVSNQEANALVAEAIATRDAEVVDTIVRALGQYAARVAEGLGVPDGQLPTRSFAQVEGLKEFLIVEWRRKHAESGFNTAQASRQNRDRFLAEYGHLSNEQSEENWKDPEFWVAYDNAMLSWPAIPKILCTFWPSDSDVLELVWENQEKDRSDNVALQTLALLNTGQFRSPSADRFRTRQLRAALGNEDASAHIAVMFAAEGLAFSASPEALSLLIDAGKKHPAARTEVIVALSAWDDEQLKAHAEDLSPLVERYETIRPMGADVEAQERLKSVLGLNHEREELAQ